MNIAVIFVALFCCASLLTACGDGESANQPYTAAAEKHPVPHKGSIDKPVRGIVRGQEFRIEQAILRNNTLTLRQGKDFFADRSVDIVIFGRDSLEGAEITVGTKSGIDDPHLRLAVMQEDEGLPDEIILTNDYTMELVFGESSDLGMPFTIKLATKDAPRTDIDGAYFATFYDIKLKNGKADLTYDSFDTLRHIASQYLHAKYKNIELLEDFDASYRSHGDTDHPKSGFIGYESIIAGSPSIVKLQLRKDIRGWRVARQLAENQISQAHPFDDYAGMEEPDIQAGQAKVEAALILENYLNDEALMPRVRSTSVGCYISKSLDKASCRAVYGLKEQDEIVCMNRNYLLLRNRQGWQVEKELADTEKVDHATGKLVNYTPFDMICS